MNSIHKPARELSIDFLRGFVIILMTLDHTRDIFSSYSIGSHIGIKTPLDIYFTRWITHICAPVFVFLAGMSAYLNKSSKNLSRKELQIFLIKRALFLIILEFSIVSFLWNVIFPGEIYMISAQVIWAIGASMLFLALLLFLSDLMIFIIGLGLIFTNNLFDIYTSTNSVIWNFLHNQAKMMISDNLLIISFYPLYPWLGIMAAGYGFCSLIYANQKICPSITKRKNLLIKISFTMFLYFVALRFFNFYGDANQFMHGLNFDSAIKSFLDVTKYPPSLHYILITLSLGFLILTLAENKNNKFIKIIANYGSVPLFYYVIHLSSLPLFNFIIIKIIYQKYKFKSDQIWISWICTAVLVVLIYPLVLWFINFKKSHRQKLPILNYL